jgi:hypothetical protein
MADWEKAERLLGRLHLLHWLVLLAIGAISGWITYADRLPPIVVSLLAAVGAATIAGLILAGVYKLMQRYPRFFGLHVPFSKAAAILYAKTEGTFYNNAIAESHKTPDEKLQFMGNTLLSVREGGRRARIYAKKAPSPVSRQLSEADLKQLHWKFGSDDLLSSGDGTVAYSEAMVDRFDLNRYAGIMRKGDASE